MIRNSLFAASLAVGLSALGVPASAQQHVYAVRPIDGYACMKLNVTEQEVMDPRGGVPIRTAPTPSAPIGTLAPSVLLVKQPLHAVGGYVEVLQLTGQPGWIEQSRVRPFDPLARCVPSMMSNGRPGIG